MYPEERRPHLLIRHLFDIVAFESEYLFVIRDRRIEAFDRDTQVFDVRKIHNVVVIKKFGFTPAPLRNR